MSDLNSGTVDPDQTKAFSDLSKDWWSSNSPVLGLHRLKDVLTPYIQESIIKAGLAKEQFITTSTPLKGVRILDAGCGGGILAESLAELGCIVDGVDVNSDLIKVAKDHAALSPAKFNNLTYEVTSIEDHAQENAAKYDVVISNFVVEHINEIELYLKSCIQCLRPNGLIFVSSIGKTIMGWLLCIVLPEKIFKLIPHGMHQYDKFVNVGDIETMLSKYNCKTEESRGILYNTDDFVHFFVEDTSGFYITKSIKE